MSKSLLSLLLAASFTFTGCNEIFRPEMEGQLVVEPGRDLQLKDTSGHLTHLGTSPAIILAQDRGVNTPSRAELRVGKKKFLFQVPQKNFDNLTDFAVPAGVTGQKIGIRAHRTTALINSRTFEGPIDCYTPGVCQKCGPGIDANGEWHLLHCRITESQTCPGHQPARQLEETHEDTFTADLIPEGGTDPIAHFVGKGWVMQQVRTLVVLGECKQSFGR